MKRIWGALSLAVLLIFSGCIPALERTEEDVIVVEETEEEEETEYVITPTIESPDHFYRNVLEGGTYYRSEARGNVAHAMQNRVDLDQFEMGLMEIASGYFDQEEYYFREGSHLGGNTINSWLRRYDPDDERNEHGLNPALAEDEDSEEDQMGEAPLVLSHIMEHNYFVGDDEDVSLGGVVIGISLRSVYYFRTEDDDGGYHFHEEDVDSDYALEYGQEAAQEILDRMRTLEELDGVPITFALYMEEPRGAVAPGGFVSISHADGGDSSLGDWEAVSEDFIVFPSGNARENHPDLSSQFSEFRDDVENFIDRQVGVVGKGRYKNDALEEFKIELNLQSHGKAEIVALTQFISGRVDSVFSTQAPIYVYVESVNGTESLIVKYPDQDPYIHVYR